MSVARWPLVLLAYTGRASNEQWTEHLHEVEDKVLRRRQPFAQVIDQRHGEMPDVVQRSLVADHQQRMAEVYEKCCIGEAYVGDQHMRAAMRRVFWQAKPPYPYEFFETLGEGMEWARGRLRQAGIATPTPGESA